MSRHASSFASGPIRRALSGVLFPAFFLVGENVAGRLATASLPMPDAPVAEVVAYYGGSRSAAMVLGAFQALSAFALLVFAGCVVLFLRRTRADGGSLVGLTGANGVLAPLFLLASALLALALTQVAAAGGDAALIETLRSLNFLTGGTLQVASLGVFVGAASLAARRLGALPGWIVWLGIAQAVVSVLSLASLVVFYAALFILLGRMLGFVWCIVVGVTLARGRGNGEVIAVFPRNERGERRASPRVYRLLLTAHIITSVGWLGVVFAKLVLAVAAATAASPDVSAALLVALNAVNAAFAPASTGAIVSGVLLSAGTRWGLLHHYWVVAKLVLTVGVFGTAVQVVPRIVGLAVEEPTLLGLPWAPAVLLAFAAVHLLMLGAATALAVYKPWGKTWLGRRKDARRRTGPGARPGAGDTMPARLDRRGSVEQAA